LVVVGDGQERLKLARRYRSNTQIIFTGLIKEHSQLIDILRGADAFFLPSVIEGLSLAMLEAMSSGVATIATNVGDDGYALEGAGIVLDPSQLTSELSAAMKSMIENPELCQDLGSQARKRVLERYSLEKNIDQVVDIYHKLTEKR